ncbi:hypothetical protein ACVV42_27030, partial [Klebsiella pneumoniae]|uniref:hypothetical protein n=1 Tax=Klebsiella pneumoniae TaxID=573 RepID=UPI002480B9F3
LERWIKGSAILGCVGCLVGHLFMFLVGGKTPDQSVHLNLTTTTVKTIFNFCVPPLQRPGQTCQDRRFV